MNPRRCSLVFVTAAAVIGGCAGSTTTEPPVTDAATFTDAGTVTDAAAASTTPVDATVAAGPVAPRVDPDVPLPVEVMVAAPTELGPLFVTADDPLPAQTTSALANAGGEALAVNEALTRFGVLGIPRPSGVNSAVMELRSAGSLLPDGNSSLTVEVVYMVASGDPIEVLLATAAGLEPSTAPVVTVADYDGTTGDPRCARLPVEVGPVATGSVEGCEYRADPLQRVRSVGFRRLNLPVADPLRLPAVFDSLPAAVVDAGTVEAFSASFGRPTGPSGNTIQLEVRVVLDREPELDAGWQPDGAGRWWRDGATVTITDGRAVWRLSTRADRL